jgi:hypothetical protein
MAAVVPIGQSRPMLEYALAYAALGWPVFPVHWVDQSVDKETGEITNRCSCHSGACERVGKHPLTARGFQDAATDPESIRAWWGKWPMANIGVATGAQCWVLDIDFRSDKNGHLTVEALEREHGLLPDTQTARSQSGGRHYFFAGDASVQCSKEKVGPGVDVRGSGGYIIVEPSRIDGTYAFDDWDVLAGEAPSLAPAPNWLLEIVTGSPRAAASAPIGERFAPPETLDDLRAALAWLDCSNYQSWIDIGHALKPLGDNGFWLWDEWSRPYPGYNFQQIRQKWHSFKPTSINYESIFARAAARGWQNPRARGAAPAAKAAQPAPEPSRPIDARPFKLRDPATIEPRDWLYKRIFIRRYVTGTFAPGAAAKTQINLYDLVTMACGFNLDTRKPLKRGPLRVWYINVEDDMEEIERRLAAICLHYGITDDELGGRLFVDTDREGRYLVAETSREGVIVRRAVVDAILAQISERGIDLLLVDPLVGLHAVSENSNPEMNRVIAQLRRVAEEGDCGVHVIHHVRKGSDGDEVSVEDGRGASAIKDACRAVRTLTPMSEKEAADFGVPIEKRRFYVWANHSGKPNLAPPMATRDWYFLRDVGLGNARPDRDEDRIGVPTPWDTPSPFDGVSLDDCRRIWAAIGAVSDPLACLRDSSQSVAWIGALICDRLGWDRSDESSRAQARRIVTEWASCQVLELVKVRDVKKGRDVPCYRLGPAAKLD